MSSGYVEETWKKHIPDPQDEAPKHTYTKHKGADDDFHSDDEPKKKAAKLEPVSSPGGASDSKIDPAT